MPGRFIHYLWRLRRTLFQDHMRVRPTHAKRRHPSPSRLIRHRPRRQRGVDPKPKAIQINCGTDVVEAGWNHGIFNR
ncbi:Uncharacterised protein [Mycobacterium tuberculosis]|nr:Uncharacterised protein [Mycobacterium tuberculosis]CKT36818.1 Uncharacterised protein [Mycobacterium tuberculosis]